MRIPIPSTSLPLSLSFALLVPALLAQPGIHPDELKLKPKIDNAITRGVEMILKSQLRDGTWGRYGNYDGGKAALCAYALLKCGVDVEHPAVRRSLLYIDNVRPDKTYTVACMLLAYGAAGKEKYRSRMKALAGKLVAWQGGDNDETGDHGYGAQFTRPDLSNTQYAALGLWIAQKHKVKIPARVFRSLIASTLTYQAKPELVDALPTGKHTVSGGKQKIIGFGYTPGTKTKATGSMTTAGVAILQICKIGLNDKVGRKLRQQVDDAIEAGVGWLTRHFSVRTNPGKGGHHFYYLYGLERVGSLLRIEQMGKHWWYMKGARQILRAQGGDGGWGRGQNREVQTSFALLFLRRATSYAASTGASSGGLTKHLFQAGEVTEDVQISAAGQQPLAIWIKGFGESIKERHKQWGIRVLQVEYLRDKRVLGQLAGKPTEAWKFDAFLHRVAALPRGRHPIHARVTLVAPDVATGATTATEIIQSPKMNVDIRDVFSEWMEAAARLSGENRLKGRKLAATATSSKKEARNAFDGREDTHWVCSRKDKNPNLMVELEEPVTARKIVISQAGGRARDVGIFDRIKAVEVTINKGKKPIRIELDPDQLGVTTFKLPRSRKVRRLDIRILEREHGRRRGQAGFSEIGLVK